MISVKGFCIYPSSNLANTLAALLIGTVLAIGVATTAELETSVWTNGAIESAFHDVLAHGDLSDIEFLARSLGLELEVVQWEKPSISQIETEVMATRVPAFLLPYGTSYDLKRNVKDGGTRINFNFTIKSCPGLSSWATDWHQQIREYSGESTHGPDFFSQFILWQQGAEGIELSRTTSTNSCTYRLTQSTHTALSVPEPPALSPSAGSELLEQVIELVIAGDLRDFAATARILHVEMTTYGKLHGHRLYAGGATPDRVIPGTDTRSFDYSVDDTGWRYPSRYAGPPERSEKYATIRFYVDTVTTCISPESLEARMRERHIHFQFHKKSERYVVPRLRTIRRGHEFWIEYDLQGSCIKEFRLRQ